MNVPLLIPGVYTACMYECVCVCVCGGELTDLILSCGDTDLWDCLQEKVQLESNQVTATEA